MFDRLGRLVAAHPWKICFLWLIASVSVWATAPAWNTKAQDDDIRFLPERCPSVRGYQLLGKAFPRDVFASRLIFAFERDRALTVSDFAIVDRCVAALKTLRTQEPALQIGKIVSHRDFLTGKRLTSSDGKSTLVQVSLGTPFLALQTRNIVDCADTMLRSRLAEEHDPPRLLTTGPAGIGRDLSRASSESLDGTTLATIVLVVVVLLLVYRAPLLAIVPLVTIAVSVWISLHALALLTLIPGVYLVNVSKVFAIVILYGAGTDYCLFLISRYKEELQDGLRTSAAIGRSVGMVGGALAASAGTVICGLGLMGFAEFAKVRCAGPAIALSLAVALLASLTLAPALLKLLGRGVFWPRTVGRRFAVGGSASSGLRVPERTSRGFWEWASHRIVARPILIWSVASLLLMPLVIVGLQVSPIYRATGELHPRAPSVKGLTAIQRHFTAGEVGPLTVLLDSSTDWNSADGRDVISHLSKGFAHLENVAEVRSLTQPLGAPMLDMSPKTPQKGLLTGMLTSFRRGVVNEALEQGNRIARDFYVAELTDGSDRHYVTRLDVILHTDPFAPESIRTAQLIQVWLDKLLPETASSLRDVRAELYGVTVNAHDLAEVTEGDRVRINMLVLGGIFIILLVLVRKPWLACYLLLTVLLSYYATLGATALIGWVWANRAITEVDWRVPFFLFTILVAIGEDYNILLITRMLQERRRFGPLEGTRRALARTGGTITSCGIIMAGTFATLMLGGLGTLVQIGFALAFGVLLDAFVIRPFLVPAFTLTIWKLERQQLGCPATPLVQRRAA
jgi:RND superfamily putative drug exporter